LGLLLGDIDRDLHVNVADISALMTALRDLNAYQAAKNLFGADLLAVADTSRDTAVTNTDLQGLIVLLANSPGGGGGSAATGAATAVASSAPTIDTAASQAPTIATVPSAASLAPTIATVPRDPQPNTSTQATRITALAVAVPDAAASVSRRSTDRSPSTLSSKKPQPPSLKTTLIDQAIRTLRRNHGRQLSAIATSAQLEKLFAAWR
jgi:hypothetical protein